MRFFTWFAIALIALFTLSSKLALHVYIGSKEGAAVWHEKNAATPKENQ